jgi:hypothetical protein
MVDTDKYDLDKIDFGTSGWNVPMTTNMEKVDDHLHTRILVTLGETVAVKDALYQDTDSKFYKALADGTKQPARGLAVDAGILDDEIRLQRIGPFQNPGFRFKVPFKLYLDDTAAGELSHHKPVADDQLMGHAIAADTIFLDISNKEDVGPAFFGTSTSFTSTSTSTSGSTSSSSSCSSTTTTT